jgi:hypothetical protein
VIVRDESEYRGTGEFSRDSETYVRGRNAAPEGFEWINSSGLGLAYGKFHGLKWRGRKWTNDPEINMDKMDDEMAGKLEEEDNTTSPNAEEGPEKAATEPTQTSVPNREHDIPKQPQSLVTEVEVETADERSKENASPVTPKSNEELVLPERPVSG